LARESAPATVPGRRVGDEAKSGDVRACVAAPWFRWANGRMEALPDDACSLLAVNQRFAGADDDRRAIPLAIVTGDAFRDRSGGAHLP